MSSPKQGKKSRPEQYPVAERAAVRGVVDFVRNLALRHPDPWAPIEDLMAQDADIIRAQVVQAAELTYPDVKQGRMWASSFAVLCGIGLIGTIISEDVGGWITFFGVPAVFLFVTRLIREKWAIVGASRTRMVASLSATAVSQWAEAIQGHQEQIETYRAASRGDSNYTTRHPRPEPQPYGVSHEGAEALVSAWMRHLGDEGAEITRYSGDGGIDVASNRHIAQVKNYAGAVPVAEIREFFGVAAADGRAPLFFTSGTYAEGAAAFAAKVDMALFIYGAATGELRGANEAGRALLASGL